MTIIRRRQTQLEARRAFFARREMAQEAARAKPAVDDAANREAAYEWLAGGRVDLPKSTLTRLILLPVIWPALAIRYAFAHF